MDTVYSLATHKPQGYYAAIDNVVENPSADKFSSSLFFFLNRCSFYLRVIFDAALMPVGDGLTGMAGGAVARSIQSRMQLNQAAEFRSQGAVALEVAEANRGKLPEGQSMQQYNTAQDLIYKAEALEARAAGKENIF